jgi:hypothetical protein
MAITNVRYAPITFVDVTRDDSTHGEEARPDLWERVRGDSQLISHAAWFGGNGKPGLRDRKANWTFLD